MTATQAKQATCREQWAEHKRGRLSDIRRLWHAEQNGNEDGVPDLGTLNEYGLSFDYVAPGTFGDQPRGYWRWQLSWGGPSDEIRFYGDLGGEYGPAYLDSVQYVFMDWFDGHTRALRGRDRELLETIFRDWLTETGTTWKVRAEAMSELNEGRE